MIVPPEPDRVRRRLRIVRWLALADALLLVLLLAATFTGARAFVHVLGPLHGINFLVLIVTAATAAIDGLWGWWFPAVILVTAGPIGAFVGEWIIGRQLVAPPSSNAARSFHSGGPIEHERQATERRA